MLHEGDDLRRTQVVQTQEEMLDMSVTWRTANEAKCWVEVLRDLGRHVNR